MPASLTTTELIANLIYILSILCFILGIKRLGRVRTALTGNRLAALGMFLAVVGTFIEIGAISYTYIIIGLIVGGAVGIVLAVSVKMTAMPELVAMFNGFGGAASGLVAVAMYAGSTKDAPLSALQYVTPGAGTAATGGGVAVAIVASIVIGFLTFTGSMVAFLKLREWIGGKPALIPGRHLLNGGMMLAMVVVGGMLAYTDVAVADGETLAIATAGIALVFGVFLVIPIGGADMPVVISLLNSFSGLAASAAGFALGSNVLIVSGALVGASGLILTMIMCKAMNRTLMNVLFGGFGADATTGATDKKDEGYRNVKSADADEVAMILEDAQSVIFVPGYGLAVSQGQHAVRELADLLESRGATVRYAIHPVAGRMPGHMNVLLAEANVPYEQLFEMDQINGEFKTSDVALVIGANDVVNPAAKTNPASPIYGMPVLNVEEARTVFVMKRSLGAGFAGIKNELFEHDRTLMVFGDGKKTLENIIEAVKED